MLPAGHGAAGEGVEGGGAAGREVDQKIASTFLLLTRRSGARQGVSGAPHT